MILVAGRGLAYVFQLWWALDFRFICNVSPPQLKGVSLTPKSPKQVTLEGEFNSPAWLQKPLGRIYFASSGKTYVIQSGTEYKELAVYDLNDHPDYTSAAVSNGRIFIKGKSYLWCIGTK